MSKKFDFLTENLRSGGWLTLPLFRLVLPAEDNSLFFFATLILFLGMTLGRMLPQLLEKSSGRSENSQSQNEKPSGLSPVLKRLSRALDYLILTITSLFYLLAGYAGLALFQVVFRGVEGVTDYDRWVQNTSYLFMVFMIIILYLFFFLLRQPSVWKKLISHVTSALMIGVAVLFIYRGLLFDNFQEVTQHFLYPQFSSVSIQQMLIWFCLLTVTIYSSVITGKALETSAARIDFRVWWSLALSFVWPVVFCLYFIDTRWSLNLLGDPLLDLGRYLLPLWLGPLLIAGLSFLLLTLSLNGALTALIKVSHQLMMMGGKARYLWFPIPALLSVVSFAIFKSYRGLDFAEGLIFLAAACVWLRMILRWKNSRPVLKVNP